MTLRFSLHLAALLSLLSAIMAPGATHYVSPDSSAPVPPYTNWVAAATNIQDAINAADPGDLVLVTNGVYQTGGALDSQSMSNRVVLNKPLVVQSINGPAATTIMGAQGNLRLGIPRVRCACLTNGASLVGFTLTNGSAGTVSPSFGGGVYGTFNYPSAPTALVSNCVLTGNSAYSGGGAYGALLCNCLLVGNSASIGGGASTCTLNSCILTGNVASGSGATLPPPGFGGGGYFCNMTNCLIVGNSATNGGGACSSRLINCTIVSNTASFGGGIFAYETTALTNCIVFYNSAGTGPNYQPGPSFSHCCTTPLPSGPGNITNEPGFLNLTAGDLHLQTNSSCINAGVNSAIAGATDLDGNPRIAGGTVDIGAYEFESPSSIISYAWLQQYHLPTDGSADSLDSDGDGMSNWQEWQAGTDPTDDSSVLRISSISVAGAVATVRWQSVSGVTYCLERSNDLLAQPSFLPVQSNIAGIAGTLVCSQTNGTGVGSVFYRLRVQ